MLFLTDVDHVGFEKANETRQNNLQSATVSLQVVIGLCKRKETAALKIKAAVSNGRVKLSALRRLFFFCRRAADYSIFMKLGASQIYGEKNQRQFPKRSMPLGLPISHTAYRCSFVPPIEAKQPEHGRQEEARPIGTMDLFPGSAAKPGTEKLPSLQPKLQSDFY